MQNQHIGVQKVTVKQGNERNQIQIEMMEHNQLTRLFINGIRVDKVYPFPQTAYLDAARILKLRGAYTELEIDVACNVMDVGNVEQTFRDFGVNVHSVVET